jgi:exonuclease SbcD
MRFTFIHAADLHIDSPFAGLRLKDEDVARQFVEAGRRAVQALIDEAITSEAAFLIIAGDVFDGDWKDVTTGLFFVRAIAALDRAGIPAFIVKGNHDAESLISRDLPYPKSVHFFPTNKATTITLDDYRVALHGRSFPTRLTGEFVNTYPAPQKGWLNIGVLHTSLDGSRGHDGYAPCSVDDLKGFGYDYWALGHVHAAEVISRDPWIVYPGNLQGRNIRETGPKGAVRVTVEDGRITDVTPLALDAARWAHLNVDVAGAETEQDVLARIAAALAQAQGEAEGRPLAARVALTGITPHHFKFVSRREALQDEVRAVGFAVASDCWVEQLKIKTSHPLRPTATLTADEALDIESLLEQAADDPDFATILAELTEAVTIKLPKDLQDEFARSDLLKTVSADAQAILIGEMS